MRGVILTATFTVMLATIGATAAQAQERCDAPQILVVLDQSSSMGERAPLADGSLKWDAAVTALSDLTDEYESTVDFGLMLFPSAGECTPGVVDVPVARNNADEIVGALPAAVPYQGNWTPMAQSLNQAASYAPLLDPARRNYVALITDGWQWCDPYDVATRFDPVGAVEALTAAGVTTFVIGFGDGVDALTLNQAAQAAGTTLAGCDPASADPARADNCYFQVDDLGGLDAALDAIAVVITEETCDGLDNDCDGEVDEDLARACSSACGEGLESCVDGAWGECDALSPADEICDGLDNDCDGVLDEGCDCEDGDTRPCGDDEGECSGGTQRCADGRWSECDGMVGPVDEICDGLDNDCDGEVDEDGANCANGAACVDGECVAEDQPPPDPCDGVTCDTDQYCLDGTCVDVGGDEPEPEDEPPANIGDGGGSGGGVTGCDCQVAGGAAPASPLAPLLALVGLVLGVSRLR
jgi:hypothetical protein